MSTRIDAPAAYEGHPAARSSFLGADALIEEARQRQRRRWRRRVVLCASAVLLAAAVAVVGFSGQAAHPPAGGHGPAPAEPAATMPSQIVVWTDNFRIEVVSARTGRLIRTLATNVALYRGLPTVAVSRDGIVYFDNARNHRQWVLSVPLAGGRLTPVAAGYSPAISPNGRLLAYVAWTDCVMPCVSAPEAIVVRDLVTGTQQRWSFTSSLNDITALSWAPDGRHLAFAGTTALKHATVIVQTARVLDTRSGGTLDDARPIPLGQRVAWAGYLTASTGVGVMLGPDGMIHPGASVVEVGVKNGRVIERLTVLSPGGLGVANAIDGTEGAITADRGGRYFLIAGQRRGRGVIFFWTFGMRRPVAVVSDGAMRATWAG